MISDWNEMRRQLLLSIVHSKVQRMSEGVKDAEDVRGCRGCRGVWEMQRVQRMSEDVGGCRECGRCSGTF